MKKSLTTAGALEKGKKAYRKPSLKSFGKVSVLTRSEDKGSIYDAEGSGGDLWTDPI